MLQDKGSFCVLLLKYVLANDVNLEGEDEKIRKTRY